MNDRSPEHVPEDCDWCNRPPQWCKPKDAALWCGRPTASIRHWADTGVIAKRYGKTVEVNLWEVRCLDDRAPARMDIRVRIAYENQKR